MVDFIGIGAQKSGTSWAYACLYEHPEICAPVKELHFFSRPRYGEGIAWYESHFKKCDPGKLKGEFSTSYLYSELAPSRIKLHYPNAKLIVILRNPVTRAYSQYRNAIKAGEISESITFDEYRVQEASVCEQGYYAKQLRRYYALFPKEQLLVLIYEDIKKDPIAFMKRVYAFLGVDENFVASMVHDEINVARTPKLVVVDRAMHRVAEFLRRNGFDKIVHVIRRLGLPDLVRLFNTKTMPKRVEKPVYDYATLAAHFRAEVNDLSVLLERDLHSEWNI